MKTKLQGMSDWTDISSKQNGLRLMSMIRDILHNKDKTEQSVLETLQADKAIFLCSQKSDQSCAQYLQTFKAKEEVCKSSNGRIPRNYQPIAEKLAKQEKEANWDLLLDKQKEEYLKKAETAYLATLFFTGLYDKRYKGLKSQVRNDWVMLRKDNVPTTYEAALRMADGYKSTSQVHQRHNEDSGVAFVQPG